MLKPFYKHLIFIILSCLLIQFFIINISAAQEELELNKDNKEILDLSFEVIEKSALNKKYIISSSLWGLSAVSGLLASYSAFYFYDRQSFYERQSYMVQKDKSVLYDEGVVIGLLGTCLFGVSGTITWYFPTNSLYFSEKYKKLPEKNLNDIKTKVRRGEFYLKSMAESEKKWRYYPAGIFLSYAVAETVLYLTTKKHLKNNERLYFSTFIAGLGLYNLLVESIEEEQYKNYLQMKSNKKVFKTNYNISIIPHLKGGILLYTQSF